MTLKEAIDSGRPFARPGWDTDLLVVEDLFITHDRRKINITPNDVAADDWVICDALPGGIHHNAPEEIEYMMK